MSTRATYKINTMTLYVHHDGYPEGAAEKFHDMIHEATRNLYHGEEKAIHRTANGGYLENFIRGNANAEFTGSHDDHGDTEYQYTLKGRELSAYVVNLDNRKTRCFFQGDVSEFINRYGRRKVAELKHRYGGATLYTVESLDQYAEDKKRIAKTWQENGLLGANFDSLQQELKNITQAFMTV